MIRKLLTMRGIGSGVSGICGLERCGVPAAYAELRRHQPPRKHVEPAPTVLASAEPDSPQRVGRKIDVRRQQCDSGDTALPGRELKVCCAAKTAAE
jgi:hypothetical protein